MINQDFKVPGRKYQVLPTFLDFLQRAGRGGGGAQSYSARKQTKQLLPRIMNFFPRTDVRNSCKLLSFLRILA